MDLPYFSPEYTFRVLFRTGPESCRFFQSFEKDISGVARGRDRFYQADTPKNSILHLLYQDYNRILDQFSTLSFSVEDLPPRLEKEAGLPAEIMIYGLYRFGNKQKEWLSALASVTGITIFMPPAS